MSAIIDRFDDIKMERPSLNDTAAALLVVAEVLDDCLSYEALCEVAIHLSPALGDDLTRDKK